MGYLTTINSKERLFTRGESIEKKISVSVIPIGCIVTAIKKKQEREGGDHVDQA